MGFSLPHILLILILVLVLFGAGKLPKVMGDLGKGVRNMKDGLRGDEADVEKSNRAKVVDVEPILVEDKRRTQKKAAPARKKATVAKTTAAKKPVAKKAAAKKAPAKKAPAKKSS